MKASDYRKQVELRLEQQQENALESAGRPTSPPHSEAGTALAALQSPDSDTETRAAALDVLRAASFDVVNFAEHTAAFHAALQQIAVNSSADPELRRDALEILVSEQDDVARQVLQAAITDPQSGAVPVTIALSLLARDDHGAAVDLARQVLQTSEDSGERAQAIRILGTVPEAAEELGRLLGNKGEAREVRKASAVALRALSPDAFEAQARRMLEDTDDFPEIRATLNGVLRRGRNAQ